MEGGKKERITQRALGSGTSRGANRDLKLLGRPNVGRRVAGSRRGSRRVVARALTCVLVSIKTRGGTSGGVTL